MRKRAAIVGAVALLVVGGVFAAYKLRLRPQLHRAGEVSTENEADPAGSAAGAPGPPTGRSSATTSGAPDAIRGVRAPAVPGQLAARPPYRATSRPRWSSPTASWSDLLHQALRLAPAGRQRVHRPPLWRAATGAARSSPPRPRSPAARSTSRPRTAPARLRPAHRSAALVEAPGRRPHRVDADRLARILYFGRANGYMYAWDVQRRACAGATARRRQHRQRRRAHLHHCLLRLLRGRRVRAQPLHRQAALEDVGARGAQQPRAVLLHAGAGAGTRDHRQHRSRRVRAGRPHRSPALALDTNGYVYGSASIRGGRASSETSRAVSTLCRSGPAAGSGATAWGRSWARPP